MADELVSLLRRLLHAGKTPPSLAGEERLAMGEPTSPFEALLQERLRSVEAELVEVRSRVNGLMFLVAGAVLTQLVLRLLT